MPVSSKFIFIILMISTITSASGQSFVMNERCVAAYQNFMSMKVTQGKNLLAQEIKVNPKNMMPFVLINYEDFITLVFNEDPVVYKQRKALKDKRLNVLDRADKKSAYYLFSKALIYFQWSMIQVKYSDYWDAAWDFRKSFLLFRENKKKFPDFASQNIFIGAQEAVISAIPNGYKWISHILGLKGNMKTGIKTLNSFINTKETSFREEALLYAIYLKNYLENDPEGADVLISSAQLDTKNNQMFCFMAANLALNNKNAAKAESILINRNKSAEYMPFPLLEYELADALMRKLDLVNAILHFQNYIAATKSIFYIKDAYQGISYCYYLQNNMPLALKYKEKIKTAGRSESDADKQAQHFAVSGNFPDKDLLKSRCLNDGGYNDQALKILLNTPRSNFYTGKEKLEYLYRMGRIYDDLSQDEKALEFYNQTIESGQHATEYFAARAALQAAYIYENKNQKTEALQYFNKVLDMDNHEFKNSLDQRAKAGINRIRGL